MEQENTQTKLEAHFIEAQADLWKLNKTSHQRGYHNGDAKNAVEMSMTFANLALATADNRAAVNNLTTENSTLNEQVSLYANRLSTKEVDTMALQTAMRNIQGELKNLKSEVASLKKSDYYSSFGSANNENVRLVPK